MAKEITFSELQLQAAMFNQDQNKENKCQVLPSLAQLENKVNLRFTNLTYAEGQALMEACKKVLQEI